MDLDDVGHDSTNLAGSGCYDEMRMRAFRSGTVLRVVRLAACWLIAVLLAAVSMADVVHLKNGRQMEGVILQELPDQVRLRLPFGEIGLPRTSIERIELGRSTLAEYLDRRALLEVGPSGAGEWVALARWAEVQGLGHSAREATLVAARLEPGLPALAPRMTAMGYVYDETYALWLPLDDLMRRRGYVQSNGRWLTPEEARALEQDRRLADAREAENRRRDRLARALEIMVLTQLAQAEEERRLRQEVEATQGLPLWAGYPALVAPGYWPRPPHRPKPHGRDHVSADSAARAAHQQAIIARPPGSLIPVTPSRSHRGGFQRPPARP
jgi:hypothetical protein